MSIRTIQKNIKDNLGIKKTLTLGINPTAYEVSKRISEETFGYNFGLPEYNPVFFDEYSKSDSTKLNTMFKSLENDLSIIYKDNCEQSNNILLMNEKYDNDMLKLEEEIEKLYSRINTINELQYNNYSFFSRIIRFNSLINSDMLESQHLRVLGSICVD